MKSWSILGASLIVSTACAPPEQTLDKRGAKLAEIEVIGNGDLGGGKQGADPEPSDGDKPDAVTPPLVVPEISLTALKLAAAKDLETIKFDDIILTSKVSPNEFVLFAKDGKSFAYKPDAAVSTDILKPIEAVVVAPEGATLYSLPDQQFWFVSPDKLGRHKPAVEGAAADDKSITVEQFSTKSFSGDLSKMKVLYVSVDEVIFDLDTHLAIINVKSEPARITQLPIDKLPVDLKGVLQAGRTDAGYWFRTAANVFLLASTEVEGVSPWTKASFTVDPADLSGYAMWPDVSGKFQGQSLGFSSTGLFSDVIVQASLLKR